MLGQELFHHVDELVVGNDITAVQVEAAKEVLVHGGGSQHLLDLNQAREEQSLQSSRKTQRIPTHLLKEGQFFGSQPVFSIATSFLAVSAFAPTSLHNTCCQHLPNSNTTQSRVRFCGLLELCAAARHGLEPPAQLQARTGKTLPKDPHAQQRAWPLVCTPWGGT